MTNPFTAKAKPKLKAFGAKKKPTAKPVAKNNGKVDGKPKLRKFGGDRVTNTVTKTEDWMIGKLDIKLEEHNNLWWTGTITLDGESRVFHNKHGAWYTDRTERDDWPPLVTMQEAIPDLAKTLQTYLTDELKRLGRLKTDEDEKPKKKGRGKKDA